MNATKFHDHVRDSIIPQFANLALCALTHSQQGRPAPTTRIGIGYAAPTWAEMDILGYLDTLEQAAAL